MFAAWLACRRGCAPIDLWSEIVSSRGQVTRCNASSSDHERTDSVGLHSTECGYLQKMCAVTHSSADKLLSMSSRVTEESLAAGKENANSCSLSFSPRWIVFQAIYEVFYRASCFLIRSAYLLAKSTDSFLKKELCRPSKLQEWYL